jgi:uncharacterized damage-inducible protein DinB
MGSEPETLRAWFAYLTRARQGSWDVLAKLPDSEIHRDRGASSPSLVSIL